MTANPRRTRLRGLLGDRAGANRPKLEPPPSSRPSIAPMGLLSSALHFGIPGVGIAMAFWLLRPQISNRGLDPLSAYLVSVAVPLAGLLVAALIGYGIVEGRPLHPNAFATRMRYTRPPTQAWRSTLVAIGASAIGSAALTAVTASAIRQGIVDVPDSLPAFLDPRQGLTTTTLDSAVHNGIAGRWDLLLVFSVTFTLNILGEELWWRGYVLPRQELAFGNHAWIVHGGLWATFHAFKWWDIVPLLPMALLIARIAQRSRNNWPPLVAHTVLNSLGLITVTLAVAS